MKTNNVLLLKKTALPLYWIVLFSSLVVLLRGHNEPGGGFIAGLLASSASILWAIAFSPKQAMKQTALFITAEPRNHGNFSCRGCWFACVIE